MINLEKLAPYQLQTLIELSQSLLQVKLKETSTHHEVIALEVQVEHCPHCESKHFIKHGHRNEVQRYLCKDCHKTFGATNNSFLYSTQTNYETWVHFIACELMQLTLKETAAEIGMSKTNCFNLRHKFYGALESLKKN